MKIDVAISYLIMMEEGWPISYCEEYFQSLQLGIEALRVIPRAREGDYASFKLPLPGETEE